MSATIIYTVITLNKKLDELNYMFNNRARKNKTYSRREQYEREERSYMLPLPLKPFLLKYANKAPTEWAYTLNDEVFANYMI